MVAAGQASTGDAQFTGTALWARLQLSVEYIDADVVDRQADRGNGAVDQAVNAVVATVDGRFSGAVEVDDATAPQRLQLSDQRRAQGFTAEQHQAQAGQLSRVSLGQERLQQRRRHLQHGDALGRDLLPQQRQVLAQGWAGQLQLGAVLQGQPEFPDRGIEADRGLLQYPVLGLELQRLLHPGHVVGQRPVANLNALGLAGGTGGVDHVGQVLRVDRYLGRDAGIAQQFVAGATQVQRLDTRRQRDAVVVLSRLQDQRDAAVLHHVGQAFARVIRVQRQVGTSGLEDCQQADHQFDAALQGDADEHFGPHPQFNQPMGKAIGPAFEVGIAERLPGARHGQALRRAGGLCSDLQMHGGQVWPRHGARIASGQ
ncbi:hypothetical protein D3C79_561170 [compost metagenome]